jgi:integrase
MLPFSSMEATRRHPLSRLRLGSRPNLPTLSQYLSDWIGLCRTRGLRPATVASYAATWRLHVSSDLLATRIDQVTPQALNGHYAFLLTSGRKHGAGGLSPRSVRYVHMLLRKAYADAVRLEVVDSNPAALADPPSVRAARARVRPPWSPEELVRFLRLAEDDAYFAAYFLAATTGMRRGEVLGLRWSDVDFEQRQLRIVQTIVEAGHETTLGEPKSDRSRRSVALDQRTLEVLARHRAQEQGRRRDDLAQMTALVFASADGTPVHPACFSYAFKHRVKLTGSRHIRFHDLRHGHATMALKAGIHPKIVSERLGHSTVAITLDVYSHAIPSMQVEAAEAVAALLDL